MNKGGRPIGTNLKETADWFKLKANLYDQEFILDIEENFGLEGYALYIKTLQYLCTQDGQEFPKTKNRILRISKDIGTTSEAYKSFLDFCIDKDILVKVNDKIRSLELDEILEPLFAIRESKRETMREYMREKRKKEKEAKRKDNTKEKRTSSSDKNNNSMLHSNNTLLESKQLNQSKENNADDDVDPSFLELKKILKDVGFTRDIDEHITIFRDRLSLEKEIIPQKDEIFLLQEICSSTCCDALGCLDKRIKNPPGMISDAIRNDDYSIHIDNMRKRKDESSFLAKEQESEKQEENVKREHEAIELTELYEEVRSSLSSIKQQIEQDEYVNARFGDKAETNQNLWDFMKSEGSQICERLEKKIRELGGSFDLDEICK